jgi:hypothetical protein
MAVVQLKFDGKYAYSTIANINQSHTITTTEVAKKVDSNQIDSQQDAIFDGTKDVFECICNGDNKAESPATKCRSHVQHGGSRQHNGHHHSHLNGNSQQSATTTVKVCMCNRFHDAQKIKHGTNMNSNSHVNAESNRQRSESIKIDNWDYIYRERAHFLDVTHADRSAVPK